MTALKEFELTLELKSTLDNRFDEDTSTYITKDESLEELRKKIKLFL